MYKVLLVDDEVREMNIIKILLERQYTEQFVFYEATNGEEAVAQFEEYEPQLIFMDIRMPGMSGIDAVKAIRNQCKEVYIIMITAYNYFEFAKEAIGVGVNDFLLKPPSRSNINQAVDKFFAYIQQQEQMKKNVEQTKEKLDYWMQQMKKELAISLAYNSIEKQQIDDCFHMLGIAYNWGMCVIFSIEKMVMNNKQYEIRSICNKIDCFIQEQHISAISGILGKNIILFLLLDKQTREQCKQQAYNLIDEVKIYIQRTYGAHIKIGIGSEYIFVYELHKSYEEALVAIKQEESISKQQRIETNEGQYEKLLSKKIREGNENEAFVFLTEAFTVLHMKYKDHPAILKVRCIEFLSSITKSCLPKEQVGTYLDLIGSLIELQDFHEIIKFSKVFIDKLIKQVEEIQSNKRNFIVDKVIAYVNENYSLSLSVEETAEKFSLSPFYFSKLFKEYHHKNFVDYITEVRINKAIEFLKDESYTIKQIAYEVGYRDANYFSRVFRKTMGISPKEYRNKFLV